MILCGRCALLYNLLVGPLMPQSMNMKKFSWKYDETVKKDINGRQFRGIFRFVSTL